ncbi:alr0857 family protein [Alkalinema pantanalense CENA528]|uniref:alr0857 family protein n=1 Tax=Alkalinema pantanalense TaxID=1620705 RepID=UPI003D6EED56
MLKLTYTEDGLTLERLAGALETIVTQRVILAMRVGQTLSIEPSRASFLVPIDHVFFNHLVQAIHEVQGQEISVCVVDEDFAEVSLKGCWVAATHEAHEGMLICTLSDRVEFFIHKLWQADPRNLSSIAQ